MKNELKSRNIILYSLLFILTVNLNYRVYYEDIKKEAGIDKQKIKIGLLGHDDEKVKLVKDKMAFDRKVKTDENELFTDQKKIEALEDVINSGYESKMVRLDNKFLSTNNSFTARINFAVDSSGFQTKSTLHILEVRDTVFKTLTIHN